MERMVTVLSRELEHRWDWINEVNKKYFMLMYKEIFCQHLIEKLREQLANIIKGYEVRPMIAQSEQLLKEAKGKLSLCEDPEFKK